MSPIENNKIIAKSEAVKEILSFEWTIKNFRLFHGREYEFESPPFSSDTASEWRLKLTGRSLYPRTWLYLQRESAGQEKYSVSYTLEVADNSLSLWSKTNQKVFQQSGDYAMERVLTNEDFSNTVDLTVRCLIDMVTCKEVSSREDSSVSLPVHPLKDVQILKSTDVKCLMKQSKHTAQSLKRPVRLTDMCCVPFSSTLDPFSEEEEKQRRKEWCDLLPNSALALHNKRRRKKTSDRS